MNQKIFLIAFVALAVGFGAGYIANQSPKTPMADHSVHGGMQREMDSMMAGLDGKTGDEFDKAFLSEMIMHHEGAVDMAKAALQNAKHDEIKNMANAIISAQTTEIEQMRNWQKSWYGQ